jgi:uncharacterized protein YdeI (YjbR/CyaY-like superfamily)
MIELRGVSWDHPRGHNPMVATAAAYMRDHPEARIAWDGFPPSTRKQLLWSIVSARRPETRASRIAKVVAAARSGHDGSG